MEALRSILVLMEPALEQQVAFEAALPMARAFGASLHLLMTDYRDLHVSFYEPPAPGLVQFRESVQAAHRATLERCVERATAEGVPATFESIWGSPRSNRSGVRRFTSSLSSASRCSSPGS